MGPLGWQETVVIFMLALLLFGPKKLPELGKNLAKALSEFRRASNELKDTWHREMSAIEKETQDIKKEAESLEQVTTNYNDSPNNYDYDSSYDYGAYGYPESYDSTNATETSAVSASATQGADNSATTAEIPSGTVNPSSTGEPESYASEGSESSPESDHPAPQEKDSAESAQAR